MKRRKMLSGLVVLVVVLSGTTVLYFAGVERGGVTPALAMPPGPGCEEGAFCARQDGFGGGCAYYPCCPQGQTYCFGEEFVGYPFTKLVPDPKGDCWKYSGTPELWCKKTVCVGNLCAGSGCAANGTSTDQWQTPPLKAGGSCGQKKE